MSGISALGFADGFNGGFDRSEKFHNNQDIKERTARVDALAASDRVAAQERQVKLDGYAADDRKSLADYRTQTAANAEAAAIRADGIANQRLKAAQQANTNAEAQNEFLRTSEKDKQIKAQLALEAPYVFSGIQNGVRPSKEYMDAVTKYNMNTINPSWYANGATKELSNKIRVLNERLAGGDETVYNSPDMAAIYNKIHSEALQSGVGENGIRSKTFLRFEDTPDNDPNTVIPIVQVTYDDGTTKEQKVSVGRSADKNDPYKVLKLTDLVDDMQGTLIMMDETNHPAFQARLKEFASAKATKPESNKGKEIADLMTLGVSVEEATQLAYKDTKIITDAIALVEASKDEDGIPTMDIYAALQQIESLKTGSRPKPKPTSIDTSKMNPKEVEQSIKRVFDTLRNTPNNKGLSDATLMDKSRSLHNS